VQIFESYGELKVTDKGEGGKALAQVYVKVFAKDKSGKKLSSVMATLTLEASSNTP
jgi:hypothetical protein